MSKKILIVSLTRMGDLIQSTPLIEGLRKKYPQAHITMMVSSDFADFAGRIPHIDEVVVFSLRQFNERTFKGSMSWVEIYRYMEKFLDALIPCKFDLLVNLSHSKLSALMISYLGIKDVRGFTCDAEGDRKTGHPWMQYFGTEPFNRALNSYNLVDIFTRSGDIVPDGRQVTIKSDASDDALIAEKVREMGIQADELLIGVQAGSSLEGRRWSARSFAELADLLAKNLNARILLFGVASESSVAQEVVSAMTHQDRVIDLTGKTKIPELIAWLRKCQYLVTNDTGTMHIAAALGTKIVGLFFAHAHPHETGPYGPGHIVFQARIPCAPCSYGVHCNNVVCIQKVRPQNLYSMISLHRANGIWKLPDDMGGLDELNVYETCFDDDCFLRLKPLIKRLLTPFDVFLAAYRKIWIHVLMGHKGGQMATENLNQMVNTLREDYNACGVNHVLKAVRTKLQVFHQIKQMGEEGEEIAGKIIHSFKTGTVSRTKMQTLSDEIVSLDKQICQVGLTHYEVKPITDMFNKRKENLLGDDVLALARITKDYYRKTIDECALMIQTVSYTAGTLETLSDLNLTSAANSIKVAVPGR